MRRAWESPAFAALFRHSKSLTHPGGRELEVLRIQGNLKQVPAEGQFTPWDPRILRQSPASGAEASLVCERALYLPALSIVSEDLHWCEASLSRVTQDIPEGALCCF